MEYMWSSGKACGWFPWMCCRRCQPGHRKMVCIHVKIIDVTSAKLVFSICISHARNAIAQLYVRVASKAQARRCIWTKDASVVVMIGNWNTPIPQTPSILSRKLFLNQSVVTSHMIASQTWIIKVWLRTFNAKRVADWKQLEIPKMFECLVVGKCELYELYNLVLFSLSLTHLIRYMV